MSDIIKHIPHSLIISLNSSVVYTPKQIDKKILVDNNHLRLVLFAFSQGQALGTHSASGDVLINCLEGSGEITLDGTKRILHTGESLLIPASHPHSVLATENFKMLLIVAFPEANSLEG